MGRRDEITDALNWLETDMTVLLAKAEQKLPPALVVETLRAMIDEYEEEVVDNQGGKR